MTIGKQIRIARKRAGLTQKELGEKLNISQAAIGQFENEKSNPNLKTIQKIANVLNIHWLDLLGDDIQSTDFLTQDLQTSTDLEFKHVWENLLVMNDIRFMNYTTHTGESGMIFALDDNEFKYFLTNEQCKKLPCVTIEQIKTLIKAMSEEYRK